MQIIYHNSISLYNIYCYMFRRTTLQTGMSRVRFPMVSLEFYSDIILPVALWPWGRLSLSQKWVPGVLRAGKCGQCVRLTTLSPSCAVVMKSGNLNFLEPSGPLQACNGTALPLPLHVSTFLCHHQGVLSLCTNVNLPDDDIKMSKHVAVYII